MRNKYHISGIGCSLIDNLYNNVDFDGATFKQYLSAKSGDGGLEPGKLVFTEELEKFSGQNFEDILFKITKRKVSDQHNIGGPAIVSLIHASQMLYDRDVTIKFIGAAGNDRNGLNLLTELGQTTIDISGYVRSDKPTPFTDVLSDPRYNNGEGERTFINNIGSAWDLTPDMIPEDFFNADMVVFGGTALVPFIHDNLTSLLKKAKDKNCFTLVNTVYDFRNEKMFPGQKWPIGSSDESYKYIDLLVVDYEESLKLSGTRSVNEAAEYFIQKGTSAFIITNGSSNLYAFSNGTIFNELKLKEYPVSDLVRSELKGEKCKGDTTGCGDNFVGGVITSIVLQSETRKIMDLEDVISWGTASGGYACFYTGGTFWELKNGQKRENVEKYYTDYKRQLIT